MNKNKPIKLKSAKPSQQSDSFSMYCTREGLQMKRIKCVRHILYRATDELRGGDA